MITKAVTCAVTKKLKYTLLETYEQPESISKKNDAGPVPSLNWDILLSYLKISIQFSNFQQKQCSYEWLTGKNFHSCEHGESSSEIQRDFGSWLMW